jgi:hypothetical protein
MAHDHLTLLAFGIAIAVVIPLEVWIRRRRQRNTPNLKLMDRFIGLDGKEYGYYRQGPSDGDLMPVRRVFASCDRLIAKQRAKLSRFWG